MKHALAILSLCLVSSLVLASDSVLKLVYKGSGKPPYMQPAPDNSGIYLELIETAAKHIGFRVEVIRVPKARGYKMLENGEADLYPALIFNEQRNQFLAYVKNGLTRQEHYFVLTPPHIPELANIAGIKQYNLIWVHELGSSLVEQAQKLGIESSAVENLNTKRAVEMLKLKRPIFYRAVDDEYADYLESVDLKVLPPGVVKVHENLFEPLSAPLYLGFSKKSPHYKEEVNPLFNPAKALSAENQPLRYTSESVPGKLAAAFDEMIAMGRVADMLKRYGVDE